MTYMHTRIYANFIAPLFPGPFSSQTTAIPGISFLTAKRDIFFSARSAIPGVSQIFRVGRDTLSGKVV